MRVRASSVSSAARATRRSYRPVRSREPQGWVVVQVLDPQWGRLCEAMDRPDLLERYPTSVERVADADAINGAVEAWMQTFDSDGALLERLYLHGCRPRRCSTWRVRPAPVVP
ncbi:MAG: CoA transferase [Acidimicrobiales bacterium]